MDTPCYCLCYLSPSITGLYKVATRLTQPMKASTTVYMTWLHFTGLETGSDIYCPLHF